MKIRQLSNYFTPKVLPIWTILLLDMFIIVLATVASYIIRKNFDIDQIDIGMLARSVALAVLVNLPFFRLFRTYRAVLRYSSFVDILRILGALTSSFGLMVVGNLLWTNFFTTPPTVTLGVWLVAYLLGTTLMISSRVVVKSLYELIHFDGSRCENVFIYGAREAGVNIAKALRVNLSNHYRLRGFVADEPELIGKQLMGVKVYRYDEHLLDLLDDHHVNTLIVSPLKMEELKKHDRTDTLLAHKVKLLTAPPLNEWNAQGLNRNQLKEIQIEDLLQRNPIEIDIRAVATHLEGKRVLITGAAGSIGSEIMRQVATFNPFKLILVDQAETPLHDVRLELQDRWRNLDAATIVADISNATRMESIFRDYKPQYIFHAAAYKHVPMMEDNVTESIQINVQGTRILADLAVKYKADKFVMVSTDKAVNPTNVMGCSKRICEIYVQSLAKELKKEGINAPQFITTRFGNVLGSNGSVIPRFRDQIQRGGPVTVTHPEIIRYFMTIPEACRLVLEAGSMGKGGEIYIFDMGKPVKIVDLAKRMITLSGRTDVKIEFTGLRHGEKLYEELLNVKELTKPTHHEKIMIANVREYDYAEVKKQIDELIAISYNYDQMETVRAMKQLVPEFLSKNSCFEALDEELKEKK